MVGTKVKTIYENPKECIIALKLMKESMMFQNREESVNALDTAIRYLEVMVMQDKQEGKEYAQ